MGIRPIIEIEKNLCGANKSWVSGIDIRFEFGYWGNLGQMGVDAGGSVLDGISREFCREG